jgi:Haem-degrading
MTRLVRSIVMAGGLTIVLAVVPPISECADDSVAAVQAIIQKKSVTADAALAIARIALKAAKDKGSQVAVAVVDQAGIPLVLLRTDYGTEHSVGVATDKAWTAVNYKHSTREIFEKVQQAKGDDSQLIPYAAICVSVWRRSPQRRRRGGRRRRSIGLSQRLGRRRGRTRSSGSI